MAEQTAPPPRRPRRRPQTNNDDAFAQWSAENKSGGQYDRQTQRYISGPYKGKTLTEAQAMMRDEFNSLARSQPGFMEQWGSRARGDDLRQGPRPVDQLPDAFRVMPNAPDLAGLPVLDKTGRQVAGPSPSGAQRFMDMVRMADERKAAGVRAVNQEKIRQIADPGRVADRAIAAQDARLAESGITDLGGGTRVMSNKYGTGYATNLTKEEFDKRKPGVIIDEKGVVDTASMMANKGKGTTTPYDKDSLATPSLNMDQGDAIRAGIQTSIAEALPGADERRAKDRATVLAAVKADQSALAATPGFSPSIAGPISPNPQAAVAASPARSLPLPGIGGPPQIGRQIADNAITATKATRLPFTQQGLPDDRPGVASQAARAQAFTVTPTAALPKKPIAATTPRIKTR